MSKKTVYRLTCIYTGRRLINQLTSPKVFHRFERNGREMLYQGVRGMAIGYTYLCSARQIARRPERVWDIEQIENPKWEAEDAVAEEWILRQRAAKKAHAVSRPHLNRAIEALVPLIKDIDFFEHQALLSMLLKKARDAARRKK